MGVALRSIVNKRHRHHHHPGRAALATPGEGYEMGVNDGVQSFTYTARRPYMAVIDALLRFYRHVKVSNTSTF